jgi:hypothetical protein
LCKNSFGSLRISMLMHEAVVFRTELLFQVFALPTPGEEECSNDSQDGDNDDHYSQYFWVHSYPLVA